LQIEPLAGGLLCERHAEFGGWKSRPGRGIIGTAGAGLLRHSDRVDLQRFFRRTSVGGN
jgi:hypothetical protein